MHVITIVATSKGHRVCISDLATTHVIFELQDLLKEFRGVIIDNLETACAVDVLLPDPIGVEDDTIAAVVDLLSDFRVIRIHPDTRTVVNAKYDVHYKMSLSLKNIWYWSVTSQQEGESRSTVSVRGVY